jgi:RNase P/RNase MRP subunit p29
MSVIGENVTILNSSDPTKKGRAGEIVLETSRTLVILQTNGRRISVEKMGTVLEFQNSKKVIGGEEILGRLEDRLRMETRL